MTLRLFHIVFITASVLLGLLLGVWGFQHGSPVLGVLAFLGASVLVAYRGRFIRTTNRLGLK